VTLSWGGKGGLKVLSFRKKSRREEEVGAREKERREEDREDKGVKRPVNTEKGSVKKSGQKKAVPEDSKEEGEGFGDDDHEADDPSPGDEDAIVEEGGHVRPPRSF